MTFPDYCLLLQAQPGSVRTLVWARCWSRRDPWASLVKRSQLLFVGTATPSGTRRSHTLPPRQAGGALARTELQIIGIIWSSGEPRGVPCPSSSPRGLRREPASVPILSDFQRASGFVACLGMLQNPKYSLLFVKHTHIYTHSHSHIPLAL